VRLADLHAQNLAMAGSYHERGIVEESNRQQQSQLGREYQV